MPIPTALSDLSTTASSNSPAGTDSISNTADDWLRAIQSIIRQVASSGTIASASTTDLSAVTDTYITVTGTTTITALGTVSAGIPKMLIFADALTLTHNGTSLILPTSANITTAGGDVAFMLSLGSGNWRCLNYARVSGQPVANALVASTSAHVGTTGAVMTGVKLQVSDIPTADFTPVLNTAYDALLVKGNNNGYSGITVASPNTGNQYGGVAFADTASGTAGLLSYAHSTDTMGMWTAETQQLSLDSTGLKPTTNNSLDLGTAALAYKNIYSVNALTVTSDEREKTAITPLNLGLDFTNSLTAIRFKWINNGNRWHFGFSSQDVKRKLGNDDAGLWVKASPNDPASREGLRLGELIPVLVKAIQELSARVVALESRRP